MVETAVVLHTEVAAPVGAASAAPTVTVTAVVGELHGPLEYPT